MTFGPRVDIRLDALRHNLNLLHATQPGARCLAAVKANAYGHGIETVSRALAGQVDALAVARLGEAVRLRRAGIDAPIVLMGGVITRDELDEALDLGCGLVIHDPGQVALLDGLRGRSLSRVWLKIETGMNRLGIRLEDVPGVLDAVRAGAGVDAIGLMTHLANADDLGDDRTIRQVERFRKVTDGFAGDISIANSAALLGWNAHVRDPAYWNHRGEVWIRPGISLYGVSPLRESSAASLGLRPVMHFGSYLMSVRRVRAGERVGYGGTWTPGRDTWLGVVAAGYGDGYSRFLPSGTPLLVNGRRASVVGIVSMDLVVVDLGPEASCKVGDEVVLWGDGLAVEEVARYAGTVPYTLVCGVIDRTGRIA